MANNNIIIFGAGGRAGRAAVAEARRRDYEVTAVVRDPAKYADLQAEGVTVVAGDVTDPQSVAALAEGHDAAVNAGADLTADPAAFFTAAAEALVASGIRRLVFVGIGSVLEVEPGLALHDTPGYPEEYRAFSLGHAAELDFLKEAPEDVDWLVVAPPPVFLDAEAERTGGYRIGGTRVIPAETFSYADLAVALVDEIERPEWHRQLVALGPA
jgi:uncharacterized protein